MKALTPLKKYRIRVFLAPLLKAIECTCELIIPFLVRSIIDDGLTPGGSQEGNGAYVLGLCAAVFGLSVFGFACTMVTQYLASNVATKFARELRENIYGHMVSLSPLQLEKYGKNKALNLVTAASVSLQSGVQMFMRLLVRAPFLVLGSVIAAFIVSPYAGLVVLGSLFLCGLVIGLVVKLTPRQYTSLMNELDAISRQGDDMVTGARVIRAFNKQEGTLEAFEQESERYRKRALSLARINAFINPLTFGFVNLAVVLVLYLGSFAYPTTGISVGSIVALVSFLTQSLNALIQFTRLVTSFSKAFADKKRIDGFLAIEPCINDGPKEEEPDVQTGENLYELKDVSVSFGGESLALSHVDVAIPRGASVGIIGGTGSGKSTMIALLARFLDPVQGVVLYRGHDIKESKLSALRNEIALVSQKPQIFKGTIRSNLTLGADYPGEALDEALKDALAYEFVYAKDGGLDAPVEENGTNLSGGQRQRLLIARALLSGRNVLVLDDATSALDYKSDLAVRQNIKKRTGITLVLVSQRATSIKDCDVIYVMDKGMVVGRGKHEELLRDCPVYREIYEAQVSQS